MRRGPGRGGHRAPRADRRELTRGQPMDRTFSQPAVDAAGMIRRGGISSRELPEMLFGRIDAINSELNAVVEVRREAALRQAAVADEAIARGDDVGPLHGVPMTIPVSEDDTPITFAELLGEVIGGYEPLTRDLHARAAARPQRCAVAGPSRWNHLAAAAAPLAAPCGDMPRPAAGSCSVARSRAARVRPSASSELIQRKLAESPRDRTAGLSERPGRGSRSDPAVAPSEHPLA